MCIMIFEVTIVKSTKEEKMEKKKIAPEWKGKSWWKEQAWQQCLPLLQTLNRLYCFTSQLQITFTRWVRHSRSFSFNESWEKILTNFLSHRRVEPPLELLFLLGFAMFFGNIFFHLQWRPKKRALIKTIYNFLYNIGIISFMSELFAVFIAIINFN